MRTWNRPLLALTGGMILLTPVCVGSVAVAFVFPLFLACREIALGRRGEAPNPRPVTTTGGLS